MEELHLDGSIGGGQILRSALSLSMITGRPFSIINIRAKRSRPGLLRQHLTAVQAAAAICDATLEGAELGTLNLHFRPGAIKGGDYEFAISTAGSCVLVLQTVLPALLRAPAPSRLRLKGGTHNPAAPPVDFLQKAWLPLLRQMGADVKLDLVRHGFAPAGGGEITVAIQPGELRPLVLDTRGPLISQQAQALVAGLPESIGRRELNQIAQRLNWSSDMLHNILLSTAQGPGNVVLLEQRYEAVTEVFAAFGQSRVRAEHVANQAVDELLVFERSGAAVGEHLADQLLLPLVLAGSGRFTCLNASEHLKSNAEVIQQFCPVRILIEPLEGECHQVRLEPR
ncbi:RNA 3'-terminal phosphate cyclase [Pseudomonas asuensis]|uniref:RNA 3'-terminal phosphate cyclase n=1 Tax=Pseudomonas asuensis TaxID=1825787 RepID=A0ABQ2GWI9_9PSED|nr:RNA 3'-terminal phosphate cyclase [Pseudomonas asuensis]GGM15035.1 RNA 3'-terminal phosphate cyclase [Pseudomonas asuensis]